MSEWKTKTIGEFKQSDSIVWRAQLSKSPDGKKFAGVRKFAVKKDGTEQITKDGVTFAYDASTIEGNVDGLIRLLLKLKGKRDAVQKVRQFYFFNGVNYLKSVTFVTKGKAKITGTKKLSEAQLFSTDQASETSKLLDPGWEVSRYEE
jgi:hypothetical protein